MHNEVNIKYYRNMDKRVLKNIRTNIKYLEYEIEHRKHMFHKRNEKSQESKQGLAYDESIYHLDEALNNLFVAEKNVLMSMDMLAKSR